MESDTYSLDGLFDMLGPAMGDKTTSLTMCNDLDEYLEMQTNFLDSITRRPKKAEQLPFDDEY